MNLFGGIEEIYAEIQQSLLVQTMRLNRKYDHILYSDMVKAIKTHHDSKLTMDVGEYLLKVFPKP